jgi:site-specific DNA-methyltransferase (cytosine-N4-specific)
MNSQVTCRIKSYIQPFERDLAIKELRSLAGAAPRPLPSLLEEPDCFKVASRLPASELARELAFWEVVADKETLTTRQSLRESTVNVVRNGIPLDELAKRIPFKGRVPLPNRRCLRYGSHGLHEYRGKFFPQLVRALINIANVPQGGVVADPFSGSGTTAVESILANRNTIGVDMNPLSVFMARTKCAILGARVRDLETAYTEVRTKLLFNDTLKDTECPAIERTTEDAEYLSAWFDPRVLRELEQIRACVWDNSTGPVRDFMLLTLSNILRRVSWQKEDDLRVRKEFKAADEIDPFKEFLEELGRSVRLLLAFLRQEPKSQLGQFDLKEADSRMLKKVWREWGDGADVVITSPPYATALPYLDTDRLSLCFLGLLARPDHRRRDQHMIGNREITDKIRRQYWERFTSNESRSPASIRSLIARIKTLNESADVGFRRRNLPSLLYKYFDDMRQVLQGTLGVLKPGSSAFVVVGNNHTIAGGERVEITTVKLLADLAESVGFRLEEEMPMEMLVSREIFKKNAIDSESILHLRKPS